MKKSILFAMFMVFAFAAFGQTNPSYKYQRGYVKKDGTYVKSHMKTNTNVTNHDNYSTTYNQNIHTGTTGSRAKDYSPQAQNYGKGKAIHTGERGGQYYINEKSNKIYVPKRKN